VDPPVAEFTANTTTIEIGQSVNFSDLSTNSPTSWLWTFAGGTPSSSSDQTPSITYNTAGTYEVTLTATNAGGSDDETKSGYITVNPGSGSSLVLETGNLSGVANSWQTVTLSNTYTSMVVVCTNDLGTTGIPAVCRIRNASGNSFDVMVQNPSGNALSDCNVHYVVVEEGVYTVAAHGIKMEAVKADATATAYATSSWVVEARTYSNSYSNPVVVGQVMSYNDTNWSVFWASGSNYKDPPSASELYAGKQVSEDTNKERKSRNTETIGYIVIEEGTGSINGIPYTAALGADTVRGPDNNASGYTYNFSSVSNASTAILSCAGMDGNNGGWPVLFDATSLTSTSMGLIFDEDQVKDSERKHTTEQVAFIVFGE
ncbi:MAG: PKD domain-containing protein, partial [bacterium]|nr:PKD domain-containing protein [bacterium]